MTKTVVIFRIYYFQTAEPLNLASHSLEMSFLKSPWDTEHLCYNLKSEAGHGGSRVISVLGD